MKMKIEEKTSYGFSNVSEDEATVALALLMGAIFTSGIVFVLYKIFCWIF